MYIRVYKVSVSVYKVYVRVSFLLALYLPACLDLYLPACIAQYLHACIALYLPT